MEARARGATLIHVDPRFSRTSAACAAGALGVAVAAAFTGGNR